MPLDELIATVCFAIACAVGLIGAFIGLQVSSFWTDELFTAWVIGADNNVPHMLARAVTDVHPPVYYILSFAYSQVAGHSDAALRLLSALCACVAIIIFAAGTARAFSLPARLFASAMATGSAFWFYQSQNARDYSLSLAIGSALLAIAIRLLAPRPEDKQPPIWAIPALMALMLVGSFVHFYLFFECVAILLALALYLPRRRAVFVFMLLALPLAVEVYIKLVIDRYAAYSLVHTWILGDPFWYVLVLVNSVHSTVGVLAWIGLLICTIGCVFRGFESQGSAVASGKEPGRPRLRDIVSQGLNLFGKDRVFWLCLAVPALVVGAGIATSILISPNITDRNILVCSPFIWGLFAKAYDFGVPGLRLTFRRPANIALAAIVLAMSAIVAGRALPRNEPYRESAAWVRAFPKCIGQDIPIIYSDKRDWAKADWTQSVAASEYGRYLAGYARPRVVYLEDITGNQLPLDLKAELRDRVDGHGCQLVGWNAHGLSADQSMAIAKNLLTAVGAPTASRVIHIRAFSADEPGLIGFFEKPSGFVFYLDDGPDRSPSVAPPT